MNIRKLDWDSDFFGLRIGRADIYTKADSEDLASKGEELQQEYDLLYVFDEHRVGFAAPSAKLVDEKVLYGKTCEHKHIYSEVMKYQQDKPNASLYHLAHISGGYSRFKLDSKFPKGSYERLYNRWIENACPQEGTNKQIFAYLLDGQAKGIITVDYNESGLAHIGLVAVDNNCQDMGVGTKMMSTVEEYLYRKGIYEIEVPTQKANKKAGYWYEKNGFQVKNITNIYHWWL